MDNHSGSSSPLLTAYNFIKQTGQAVRKTARMYGVAESTLRWRLSHGNIKQSVPTGRPGIFKSREERELAEHCKNMARVGYGLCRYQVLDMAKNMCEATGKDVEPKKDWYYSFVRRFKDISIQKPKKRQMARVKGTSDEVLSNYFHDLESLLTKHGILNKPELIWNIDETGITLDHNPPKIVAGKGEKVFSVTAGRSATTTIIAAGSSLGETIPPYIIFKGQRLTAELTHGCLPGSKFTTTPSGWSNSVTFKDFLEHHFIPNVQARPCLLLYDGHSTHITTDVIQIARRNNIHMFVLPPHSSHQLQPLDVGIFSPFKAALSSEFHKLSHLQMGRQVTREDLPQLVAAAYKMSFTVQNLMSAFRKTGVMPFNPSAVASKLSTVPPNPKTPSTRKERKDVRTVKLLFKEASSQATEMLEKSKISTAKQRKTVIPPHGAAITETEFLRKLQDKETPAKETSNKKVIKRKLFSEKSSSKENATKKSKSSKSKSPPKLRKQRESTQRNKDSSYPEVIDSQEPGPSTNRKEWLTFYDTEGSCSADEDDREICCVCQELVPSGFRSSGRIDILNWAQCDLCNGWVHLKYCSSILSVGSGEPFKCPKC